MTPSNIVSVIVAICFVLFIGFSDTSLLYYAAMLSDSVQAKGGGLKFPVTASGPIVCRADSRSLFERVWNELGAGARCPRLDRTPLLDSRPRPGRLEQAIIGCLS